MKKPFFIVYGIFIFYYLILCFLDYCNWPLRYFEQGKSQLVIERPMNLTNVEFTDKLIEFARSAGTEITYELMEDRGDIVRMRYYTTDGLAGKHELNYLYDIYVLKFTDIIDYNISACSYYIDASHTDKFIALLKADGCQYKEITGMSLIPQYLSLQTMLLPSFILLASFISIIL